MASKLSPAAQTALAKGNKIEAIKIVRGETGLGLKEAKDLVEADGNAESSLKSSLGSQIAGVDVPGVNIGKVLFLLLIVGVMIYFAWK